MEKTPDLIQKRVAAFQANLPYIHEQEQIRLSKILLRRSTFLTREDESYLDESIDTTWNRQVDMLIATDIHQQLHMTTDEYCASLPKLTFPPKELQERFSIPVLVEPRLPLLRHIEGFDNDFP